MSEKQTGQQINIVFNPILDGIFSEALVHHPELIVYEPGQIAEVVNIHNSRVRAKLSRPTLDSADSEAWEAPWDADVKLRMRLHVESIDDGEFNFQDAAGNSYLLHQIDFAVGQDGTVRPHFDNFDAHKVGEPVDERYLLNLLGSETAYFDAPVV